MATASEEIKVRVSEQNKQLIQDAARAADVTMTQFIVDTTTERARRVLDEERHRRLTVVPLTFFTELQDSLDTPDGLSAALVAAFTRLGGLSNLE